MAKICLKLVTLISCHTGQFIFDSMILFNDVMFCQSQRKPSVYVDTISKIQKMVSIIKTGRLTASHNVPCCSCRSWVTLASSRPSASVTLWRNLKRIKLANSGLFFSIFDFSIQLKATKLLYIKIASDWIRITDLKCWKWLFCQFKFATKPEKYFYSICFNRLLFIHGKAGARGMCLNKATKRHLNQV